MLIFSAFAFFFWFCIGYVVADRKLQHDIEVRTKETVKKGLQKLDRTPVGAVNRPDAHKLDRLTNPKKYEQEEEMKKIFDADPELKKAVEKLKSMRKVN